MTAKGKLRLSLLHHEGRWGSGDTASLILNLGTRFEQVV